MGARLTLQVLGDSVSQSHLLPETGRVSLGRTDENDVAIDDASISRHHAVLHLGPPLEVEDLGSSNGTILRGARHGTGETGKMIETRALPGRRLAIATGDVLCLGSVVLVVQAGQSAPGRRPAPRRATRSDSVIVRDPAMQALYQLLERIAVGDVCVLLLGETGAGKDVVAEALHAASPRAQGPLLKLNCAALSDLLLESELFGYEKGAFTGASAAKAGLLEMAAGGTVFLDEVAELPQTTQAKLLRVLEERRVLPIGGLKPREIDVRFVAATNRDLDDAVAHGRFRQDLLFRLNGVSIVVPPLRERPSEVEPLARELIRQAATRLGRPAPALSPAALGLLLAHTWPGNIRELKNMAERAVLLCGDGPIEPEHLPRERFAAKPAASAAPASAPTAPGAEPGLWGEVDGLERRRILDTLERCHGNQTQAAKQLGMARRTLIKRLDAYQVPRPRKR